MARSAASTALVIGVLAAARLGTFLPTANVAPADGITTSAILKATFAVLTALVLLVIALWPEKRVRALQSLPGSALVVLVVGIGLLFIYEILDVTQTVMGEAPSSVLTGLEEAARLSGVIALLGAIFLWIRDLLRTRDQLGISAEMARQREADFRDLFELYPDPALLIDPETARLVRFNTAAYRQLGYTAEEFAELRVDDFEAAMTVEEIIHHIRVTLEHGRDDFETRHRRRDGTVTDVHVSLVSLKTQEPTQLLAVFRDITSHKHALRDLAESERRFADVAVAAGEYIWEIDTSGTYTSITPAVEPLLGYSMEEILGHSPYDFMPTDEAARVQELLHVYAAEKSSWQGLEHVSVRSDGTVVHQRVSGLPIIDATGELLGFRGTGRDITAEKNAETAHRALSERLELATESAGLGIWDYDITSGRLDWDDRMFQLYGIDPSDFSHGLDDWTRHQLPQSRETAISRFTAAIESGTTFEAEITIERPKDGEIRILQGQAQVIRDSNGRAVRVVGINRDITQQEENRRRLSSEEAKFRTLFELAPVGIAMNDFATGEFLRFNHAVNEPAGYTQEEFAALSYWDVTPPEYEADEQAQIASMQRTGRYGPFHKEYIRKDGTRYPVLLHGFKFTTPEGHDVIWSIVQDVSEQHAAERALRAAKERFQGIFEQTSSGVAVYRPVDGGADLEFVDYNPAAEHMDQTPKHAVIGRRVTEVFPGVREIGLLEALQRVARTGHPEQLPLSKYEDDSITGWRENRVFRLSSGEIVAVYDDLTGIKQAQHESELARKDAEQASRAKSEFLANMSHEIRTPMNAVIGLSQLLMQTPLDDRQQDHANKIYHSSQMLLGIINDILDFSKIESGKLELEERPFSLDEIVDQMATLFAETAYARALELLFDIQPGLPHSLVGDSLRISQVLTNLLSNATKFTDPGGMIQLGIREEGPATDGSISVAFSVRDTGIGMSEEDVARLFQPFTQGDSSTTRRHGGTGLGLVISRRLVETMGGTLAVDSEPGAGSTFTFTVALPIDAAEEHPDGCPMIQGERILLVDDQEAARRVMRDLLMHCGAFAIEEAGNGEDAIDQVLAAEQRGEPFDFILMDWMMPDGMNGAETSQTLKQMRQTGELAQTGPPILMVSAYQKDEISLPEGLVADFLSKPVTASSVYNALMRVESGNGGVHRQTPERAPIPDLNGQTILLVEDNAINREVAGLLIQKTGARVQTAEHGGEALELVREAPPNLILMDLQMPIMDGFAATRALREEGYTVPIVALSAAVMDDDRQEAEEAGVDAHIGKPIESARLYATLAEYLATGAEAEETEELTTASADGESVLPAAVPGFDLTQGLRNLGGDDELYARQLQQFQRKIGHDYAPLLDHLRTGDTEAARRVAHTLKGLAGTLAAVELRRLAQQIDETLAHGHTVERTVIDELEQALHAAEEALSTVARSHADAHSEPTERSGSAEAIDTLKRTLERYELVDQTVLEEALAYLRSRGHACDTLETYVEQMEFDSALQILDEILTTDHGSPA